MVLLFSVAFAVGAIVLLYGIISEYRLTREFMWDIFGYFVVLSVLSVSFPLIF